MLRRNAFELIGGDWRGRGGCVRPSPRARRYGSSPAMDGVGHGSGSNDDVEIVRVDFMQTQRVRVSTRDRRSRAPPLTFRTSRRADHSRANPAA